MTERPRAYVAFFLERTELTPGRIRLRVPSRRMDREFFLRVREASGRVPAVLRVAVNPKTASILLVHDGDGHEVLAKFSEITRIPLCRRESLSIEEQRGGFQDFTVKERATLRFLGYALFSAVQVMRGEILAPGSALFAEAEGYWRALARETKDR